MRYGCFCPSGWMKWQRLREETVWDKTLQPGAVGFKSPLAGFLSLFVRISRILIGCKDNDLISSQGTWSQSQPLHSSADTRIHVPHPAIWFYRCDPKRRQAERALLKYRMQQTVGRAPGPTSDFMVALLKNVFHGTTHGTALRWTGILF